MIARLRFVFVLLVLSTSCGSNKNQLSGSVSDSYPLDFKKVTAALDGSVLVVEYWKGTVETDGFTIKLVVDLSGLTVKSGQSIDLTEQVNGGPRGNIQQIREQTVDLAFDKGTLSFSAVPSAGATVTGHFNATFTDPPGRAMQGDFDALLAKAAQ